MGVVQSVVSEGTQVIRSAFSDGEQKRVLYGHTGGVTSVATLPNGDIVTGSYDNTAIIWDVKGEQKHVLRGHTGFVLAVTVLANGDIVTGSADKKTIIWNSEGEQKQVLGQAGTEEGGHTDAVRAVAELPNGDIVTGSSTGKNGLIWSTELTQEEQDPASSLCLRQRSGENEICFKVKAVMRHTGYPIGVTSVAALQNGDIVTGSLDNTAIIWSAEGEKKRVLSGHAGVVLAVAIHPNGDIVTGSDDKTMRFW